MILAGWFRFNGINWDEFTHLHPDERFLTMVAERISSEDSLLDYLRTSESTLNPYNVENGDGSQTFPSYVYGNFPMTVTRYVAEWSAGFCQARADGCEMFGRNMNFIGYDGIHIVGRFLSALVDLIAVGFVFLIGKRLHGTPVGLIAAALMGFAVVPIQQAHFFTADNWSGAMVTVAIYCAIRASERGSFGWYSAFGVFLGLAVASRINVAPLAMLAGLAAIIWLSKHIKSWGALFTARGFDYALRAFAGVMLAALVSLIVFRVTMPYAFSDIAIARETIAEMRSVEAGRFVSPDEISASNPGVLARAMLGFNPHWLQNMEEIQRLQKPDASFPPATQWTARTPIIFPLTNFVFWGVGIAAGLAALIGCAWALWRIGNQHPEWQLHFITAIWSLSYLLFMGTRWVKNNRYFLPIYPTLLVLAAWFLVALWRHSKTNRGRTFASALTVLVLLGSFSWAFAFTNIYRNPLTRIAASDWFYENVPSGATLTYQNDGGETEAFQLPLKNHLFQTNGVPLSMGFELPEDATLGALTFNYLTDEQTNSDPIVWRVGLSLWDDATQSVVELNSAEYPLTITASGTATLDLDPIAVPAETIVTMQVEMISGSIVIADTSRLLNEHWDDPLPARVHSRDPFASWYEGVRDSINEFDGSAPVTWPDTSPDKLTDVVRWLDNSDYVVLSSQRAIWSLPRIPATWPLMIRYYETLFSGDLGFELAGEFHAEMRVGPLYISDTAGKVGWGKPPTVGWPPPSDFFAAEEAFSVYDHPPVWIFRKTDDFSAEKALAVLGTADIANAVFMNPGEATKTPGRLLLPAQTFEAQQASGTFRNIFNPDSTLNQSPLLAAAAWYATLLLLGLLAFPVSFAIFKSLPTRGYALSRIFALLIISWLVWMSASTDLLPNARPTYLLAILVLAVCSGFALLRHRVDFGRFLRTNARYLLTVEAIAFGLFALSLFIRYRNPDVWHVIWGGEKPMDLSYFTAVLKTASFPPYDPWFAGGALNYYYYGFVLVGVLPHLLGIVPTLAYNLAIPMLFSLTGLGVFSIAYNLIIWRESSNEEDAQQELGVKNSRALTGGLLSIALAILLGNLAQIGTIASYLTEDFFYPGNWFWTASRAIAVPDGQVQPITEFPFFTFLYADLHAHMIALPLTMLALTWVVNYALTPATVTQHATSASKLISLTATWLVGGLTIGVLYPTNSWDWPTYIVLGALAILLLNLRQFPGFNLRLVGRVAMQSALLAILSYALFLPFHQNFGAGFTEIGFWTEAKTGPISYLAIYGLFMLLTIILLMRELRAGIAVLSVRARAQAESFAVPSTVVAIGLVLVLAVMLLLGYWVVLIALPLVVLAILLALNGRLPANRRIVLGLIAAAFGLTMVVEFFVIEGTVGRMNTVFKFYMQVWMLLSVVGGVAFAGVTDSIRNWGSARRLLFTTLFGLLVLIAALYPLTATGAKWSIRMSDNAPRTLDGMAFLETATYDDSGQNIVLKADYQALQWIQRNIDGTPVFAEAYSDNFYRSVSNRIAMYTGNPSIVGWRTHQGQQRAAAPQAGVDERIREVGTLYNTAEPLVARDILKTYGVDYVYVGQLERVYYSPEGIDKFGRMANDGTLNIVYNQNDVIIYEVVETALVNR